jgi:CheY-like chemotaxis protein
MRMAQPGTILLADDDTSDLMLLSHALEKVAVENPIQTVISGQQLVQYLKGEGDYADRMRFPLPFLLILDWKMPGMDSVEVLLWIRKQPQFCNLLVMVLTASEDPVQKQLAQQAGANWHLIKSADYKSVTVLTERIRSFWTEEFSQLKPR